MEHIAGIPFFEIEFDKEGALHTPDALDEAADFVRDEAMTDLMVFSHGWNNDKADARALYEAFLASVAALLSAGAAVGMADRRLAFLGVYWPSKRFTDSELIPGGAASLGDSEGSDDLLEILDGLKTEPVLLGDERPIGQVQIEAIERAKALVSDLETDSGARREFVEQLRAILSPAEAHADDGSDRFFSRSPEDLFDEAAAPVPLPDEDLGDAGGAAGGLGGFGDFGDQGGAAGIGDLFSGVTAAGRRLLNFTTYYRMKARAGTVGSRGLAPALAQIRELAPSARLHLVGHSFGARVVTAAVSALPAGITVDSLSLLQAAFSHNAFAERFDGTHDGFFRPVVTEHRVEGPIIITYTRNDKAVGIAYPLASRVAGQNAAGFGERDDPYGGLGRNGAVSTPEAVERTLETVGFAYGFTGDVLYNLKADRFVDSHGAVTGQAVAYSVMSAAAA